MSIIGMDTYRKNTATAILLMAVLFLGLALNGCVTPRQIDEINVRLSKIENQNRDTQENINRVDSLMTTSAEADDRLRNELRYSVDELNQQIATLLENYNDLIDRLEKLNQKPGTLYSSPGAHKPVPPSSGEDTATASITPGEIAPVENMFNCDSSYDESFILSRRLEYEAAIVSFREYLAHCKDHESHENAYFWMAECYYSLDKFAEAITELNFLIDNFKSSSNLERALYKLGRCNEEMGKKADAKKAYQQLIDDHAGTFEAEQAQERMKDL